jgi:hypothetical protein
MTQNNLPKVVVTVGVLTVQVFGTPAWLVAGATAGVVLLVGYTTYQALSAWSGRS